MIIWSACGFPTRAQPPEDEGDQPLRARAVELSSEFLSGDAFMGIRLLGTLQLSGGHRRGLRFAELSGLAWDAREQRLYALTDRGVLFHLRPEFAEGRLVDVSLLAAFPLLDAKGRPLRGARADGEGLELVPGAAGPGGPPELLISFEGRPRIAAYGPDGRWLRAYPLPPPLDQVEAYHSANKALEAVTVHPRHGILTAPEWPLAADDPAFLSLRALGGAAWLYPRHPAPDSALTAMTALPDGSLLTLERAFVSPFAPLVIALRRAVLGPPGPVDAPGAVTVEDVAVFDTSRGWRMDNFEGLTRHEHNRYFMVSDDNASGLQRTLLMYFELLDPPRR